MYQARRGWTVDFLCQTAASDVSAGHQAIKPPEPPEDAKEVLSFHAMVDSCTRRALALGCWLEPLVGFLRHPAPEACSARSSSQGSN